MFRSISKVHSGLITKSFKNSFNHPKKLPASYQLNTGQHKAVRFISTNDTKGNINLATQQVAPVFEKDLLLDRRMKIEASPRVCLHDVPTQLAVSGLKPDCPVTLKMMTVDIKGVEFSSIAHYVTDNSGNVDVNSFNSHGGSYKGVFPAGLLTTLQPPAGKHTFRRLTAADTSKPWKMTVGVYAGHLAKEACQNAVAAVELERHMRSPGVQRVEVEHGRVRGALYIPAGPGPHPAVIDMFGASASMMEHRSAMLASRGIQSLSLPFFGYRDLPQSLKKLDLGYFEEAVDYLLSTPTAIQDRCGVVATCQGGANGIAMGVWLDKIKAVFSINASTCLYESTLYKDGEPLLRGHNLGTEDLIFDEHHRGRLNLELAKNRFMHIDHEETIPVEIANPDTMFCFGAGKNCSYGSLHAQQTYVKRLERAGLSNYTTKVYAGAGHIIEPPYGPFIYQNYQQYFPYKNSAHTVPEIGSYLYWGGTPEGNCRAQEQLWQDIQDFMNTEIRDKSAWYQDYLTNQTNVNDIALMSKM